MNSLLLLSQVTMTSLALVEFINSQRKEGEAELRHDHFIAKVPKVLGDEAAPKFKDSYVGKDATKRPCYKFPKREACLMAMSYSYDIQAKVFDYMTALEEVVKKQTIPQTYAEALQLAADQAKQLETATKERDEAIRTKQFINDKKVASAMGKVSATNKQFSSFKDTKGCGTRFATVNEVSDRTGKTYKGLMLTNWCKENDIHYRTYNMTRNTTVNNYPAIAWLEVYSVCLDELFN
jgi:hypothetical protein